ncbi:MAG: lipid IV(A) 3-deoxy-D-manno-octulosonic acid transferase [Sulfuricellaceae bacterium]|nr:lipid IV(A) 3-deoxy-D-manno-octulosonic acid transferase [Sulfuricellaceae bacterium]
MSIGYRLYTALLYLLLPYVLTHLIWRGRKQPAYLQHWWERFGRYTARPLRPVIWLHAVSVGETRAAAPLIKALQARYPDYQIVFTHMTPTGRETGEQLFGAQVMRCYLPYDYPFAVRRFLDHFRPRFGLLLETEIWPNLIEACHRRSIPLALVNARLSGRSARRYAKFGYLSRSSLQKLTLVAAQTSDDARRLTELGAGEVNIMGNLKFDMTPPDQAVSDGAALRATFGAGRRVLLAASTREGEESLLLDSLSQLDMNDLLLVIVPRHPQRFDEVAALLEQRGISYRRRSQGENLSSGIQVLLGDSMGELFTYYAACDVAIIGGSLLPFGGQNLIEACAMGKPVVLGPHTYNFAEASSHALAAGAAVQIKDTDELLTATLALLSNPPRRQAMGEAGLVFSQQHRGATSQLMTLLEKHIHN